MTNLPQDIGDTRALCGGDTSSRDAGLSDLDGGDFGSHTGIVEEFTGASTLGPGSAPGGIPLKVVLDPAEYRALERIAARRRTTPAALVEQLVLNALAHAEVPAPAESHPSRPHTTYEEATRGFARDQSDPTVDPVP